MNQDKPDVGLVTEAVVERHWLGSWTRTRPTISDEPDPPLAIPEAIEKARAIRRDELERELYPDAPRACPVRVVDSAGVVVAQWGRP